MFNSILHFLGNIGFASFTALFGGYALASVIYLILTKTLNFIGFTITTEEIIASIPGFIILILACFLFGIIGFFLGDAFQNWFNSLFSSKKYY